MQVPTPSSLTLPVVGGDDFISKPFAVDEFVAGVRRLLERAEGRSDFESALTPGTHVERIFRKLDVHTRAQAVSFAYEHGLLPVAVARRHREFDAD